MVTITFGKGNGGGPIKAPLSMPARMLSELQRNGLASPEFAMTHQPAPGIRIVPPVAPPLTSVAGLLFSLRHHPKHRAGHYPHSRKTPEHVIEVANQELHDKVYSIFRRWPRVLVRLKKDAEPA